MNVDFVRPMPPEDVQRRTVGLSGERAMQEALTFASDCVARFVASPLWAKPDKTLLDFGACWGRITRAFVPPFAVGNITGVEPNPEFLRHYRDAFPHTPTILSDEWPPLNLPALSFDFVVGYSVFSHLSERLCRAWMEEFVRLLRPNGMIALTTRPKSFFDRAATLDSDDRYEQELQQIFANAADSRFAYDRGEFVHFGSDYGESLIPERYARLAYADLLDFVAFQQEGRDQAIMFFAKR